ncbi:MAG: FG-GAP-like repeat-containing protein [Polyangiaceae bacterium]
MTRSGKRTRSLASWALLGLVCTLAGSRGTAEAAWPPAKDASVEDMKKPENWPNDPDYGFVAGNTVKSSSSGQWQFFSFIPDRSPNAPPLRAAETASGMSIDLAWRHTIGDPRVLIAVLDSGIRWDERDLIEKAYLNKGELQNHLPQHADLSPCDPLDPAEPTLDRFDCNGDGILSVADYADLPTLMPDAVDGRPKGDMNRNGVLDAGDLILNFSDGTDDDGNGYVDDISGWDFFKNDNDPYDDTRYGHGTGEAKDSTGQANNGIGEAGVCPGCRFVPLRVGDSFIANIQDFGKAVIYAADNGAKVVQEALGTINMSPFAQAALDYAWGKGTVVVASMADENSKHQNQPSPNNHTMPVHAITMLGQESTWAESFLAFNTCTNYGAQNFLSASGTACSSEATGRLAGISGLAYSMGVEADLDPPLSAGEVMQVFLMTADDVDVPESRGENSRHFWSQPGFDQRFGYGRINANSAVEWIQEGRIPPDVDITSPLWFQILYKDQLTQPVPIVGTVSARRATSYDVIVEWARGVQPEDTAFQTVRKIENVPSSTVLGSDGDPLAELDVREIDPTHEWDVDSPFGENQYTITVRVRSIAHYGGQIGDVPGELRRAYYVHSDPDLLPGFPLRVEASGESSPKLADLDGDGTRDIVLGTSDGRLHAFSLAGGKPTLLPGFPFLTNVIDGLSAEDPRYAEAPAYKSGAIDVSLARESISSSPAVADLNGDDKPEIVFSTYEGTVYVIDSSGKLLSGWPRRLPDVPSCPLDQDKPADQVCMNTTYRIARGTFASPVIEDMDGDGKLDILQAAFDGYVYGFRSNGTDLDGYPIQIHYKAGGANQEYGRIMTTPAVADFNGDDIPDILVGSNERIGSSGGTGAFYVIDGRGNAAPSLVLPGWPVTWTSFELFPLVSEGVPNSPVIGDVDGDGKPEAVMHGNGSAPLISPAKPEQNTFAGLPANALPTRDVEGDIERGLSTAGFGPDSKAERPDVMFPLFAQPSLGDMDQDGTPDLVTTGSSQTAAGALLSSQPLDRLPQHLLAMWSGKDGLMMPASPVPIEDYTFFNNTSIADLTNDGYPEAIVGSGGYMLHAADACGREPTGWPKFTGQWIIATAAIGDIDGDAALDVVLNTRNGWLYAWKTAGSQDGVIAWESFHHDNRNTGNIATPLGQGKYLGADKPLERDEEGRCLQDEVPGPNTNAKLSPSGGCGCRTSGGDRTSALWLLLGLGLLARRRPRS